MTGQSFTISGHLQTIPRALDFQRLPILALEFPGADIVVLTTATAARLPALGSKATLDRNRTAASAREAIRALGNPPAPAWIFVAAGGEIVALKLGRLDTAQAMLAARALFQTWKTIPRFMPPTDPADLQVTGPAKPPATEPIAAPPAAKPIATPSVGLNAGLTKADFAQAIEIEVVAELNLARTKPELYVEILNDYRAFIRGNRLEKPGRQPSFLKKAAGPWTRPSSS
jgi:hypothetical protein